MSEHPRQKALPGSAGRSDTSDFFHLQTPPLMVPAGTCGTGVRDVTYDMVFGVQS